MSFREKSAWIMSAALLFSGYLYFAQVMSISPSLNELAPPTIPIIIAYTIVLVVLIAICHIAIAVLSPKEANAPSDEREQRIFERAAHLSSHALPGGVVLSLGLYLLSSDGNLLFYGIFASLLLGQLVEHVLQVYLYRAGS